MTRSPAPSGAPSQRTLSAERPLSATDARKADTYSTMFIGLAVVVAVYFALQMFRGFGL